MRIILAGTIGRSGLGGQAWASLQYLVGLRALGHDVCYLEDCGDTTWVWDWEQEVWNYELDYPAAYVRACLEPFGLGDSWIYRTDSGSRGLPLERFHAVCRDADLLIVRAAPLWTWRTEYDWPRRRAFIDVDPGFTQIRLANGDRGLAEGIGRCERRFTVGQRVGAPGCAVPTDGGPWRATLPPVALSEWPEAEGDATRFTSIIRWQGFREAQYGGVSYGQRDRSFPRYLDLPRRTAQVFRMALMGTDPEPLRRHGWEVERGEVVSRTPRSYRQFIQQSRGEFSVPKHGYVAMRSGWVSDRTVCYLASGRPVLLEDTGLGDCLPLGEGLVTFTDPESALRGLDRINAAYPRHRRAARELAEAFFDAGKVLPNLLESAMN
ncbi:MAG: glycosyltransferase family 1 protein [Verrucomicrobia bacterium]|nr:glycosyltransferase family 1 protein [Verrucomicrobiota bacterium]